MNRMLQIVIAIAVVLTGISFTAPAANASDASSTTTVTATPNVLTANAMFVGTSKKVEACKAYAEKLEQQAPPRDPQALCKGKLTVKIVGKVKTPDCPPGWFGGSAELSIKFKEVLKARAFAKSIASGRVRTWARTKIVDRVKVTGEAQSNCVPIPVIPIPVYDHCPNLPGDQPSGYNCYPTPPPPPVYDHCPNLPGDQPSGYNCYPTPPPPPVVTASVSCKLPPHLYFPNGNGLVFCQASKSDGSAVKLSEFTLVGDEYAHISQVETTQYSDDANTLCPSGETCFRAQVWADKVGFANFVAKVLAGEWRGRMEIKADEF